MTDTLDEAPRPAKAPPPPLDTRAPRPAAIRLRRSAVRLIAGGAATVVAGALAWAFVIQPELRAEARQVELSPKDAGTVGPAEALETRPGRYDELPPPRAPFGDAPAGPDGGIGPAPAALTDTPTAQTAPAWEPPPSRRVGPSAVDVARASSLLFADATRSEARLGVEGEGAGSRAGTGGPGLATGGPRLAAGTVIPAALLTGVDTSRPGPVVAVVTQNLFDSATGRTLVVPQGSRVIGAHAADGVHGDRRAFVTWTRLVLPSGEGRDLGGAPGVDSAGRVGLEGRVDRRLPQTAAAVLAGAAVTTLGQLARGGAGGGWLGDAGDAVSIQGAQTAGGLLKRELDVRPLVRIEPGTPIRVLITQDLMLEAVR